MNNLLESCSSSKYCSTGDSDGDAACNRAGMDEPADLPRRRADSPVNMWFDLDEIATETLFVGTDSHTHPEQHIKNIEQSK